MQRGINATALTVYTTRKHGTVYIYVYVYIHTYMYINKAAIQVSINNQSARGTN